MYNSSQIPERKVNVLKYTKSRILNKEKFTPQILSLNQLEKEDEKTMKTQGKQAEKSKEISWAPLLTVHMLTQSRLKNGEYCSN